MPSRLIIACPPACGLHPEKIGSRNATALLAVRENGAGARVWGRRAAELLGYTVPPSTVSRHLRHYREADGDNDPGGQQEGPRPKLGDLEILDLVIQRGAQNSHAWKPTIKDTIEAMKLKMQMTGNSAFDDLIALLDGADDEELAPENPEAVAEEVERPEEDEEDLPEPLL